MRGCLSNCAAHISMCGGPPSFTKIVESKMPRYWGSGMTKRLNIDAKRAAVLVHVTGPALDCSSQKMVEL